ncbi:uncharacterized protein APUU_70029S [Aspergillus puulaauensis]|uniref:Uncharacterized protein n=1 Tax=Aspergillus puulaauensis TaxID=1220207 RepID=A0A7R7XVW7_9EURO|nr:uncharacterized protein APUU_70029S [Aspergillus puulaauensis]BCS28459.1 hypothetical protein APUU_70029S [Aspergillus puulaauensis]
MNTTTSTIKIKPATTPTTAPTTIPNGVEGELLPVSPSSVPGGGVAVTERSVVLLFCLHVANETTKAPYDITLTILILYPSARNGGWSSWASPSVCHASDYHQPVSDSTLLQSTSPSSQQRHRATMDRSTQSYRSRADEYLPKSTEPRMSSGGETEKGNPTTTATEGGSDATNEEYRLVYVRKLSAPNDPEALRLARDVLKDADNNDELCVQASGDCRAVANPEGFQYAAYNSLNNETKTFMASYERKCKGE